MHYFLTPSRKMHTYYYKLVNCFNTHYYSKYQLPPGSCATGSSHFLFGVMLVYGTAKCNPAKSQCKNGDRIQDYSFNGSKLDCCAWFPRFADVTVPSTNTQSVFPLLFDRLFYLPDEEALFLRSGVFCRILDGFFIYYMINYRKWLAAK